MAMVNLTDPCAGVEACCLTCSGMVTLGRSGSEEYPVMRILVPRGPSSRAGSSELPEATAAKASQGSNYGAWRNTSVAGG